MIKKAGNAIGYFHEKISSNHGMFSLFFFTGNSVFMRSVAAISCFSYFVFSLCPFVPYVNVFFHILHVFSRRMLISLRMYLCYPMFI